MRDDLENGHRGVRIRVINIRTEDGYRTLINDEYKEVSEDNVVIEPVGGRLKELLKEKFNIEI